jgi:hypothetical protein
MTSRRKRAAAGAPPDDAHPTAYSAALARRVTPAAARTGRRGKWLKIPAAGHARGAMTPLLGSMTLF